MRFLLVLLPLLFFSCQPDSTAEKDQKEEAPRPAKTEFDEELAKQLGADDYGMAQYVMAFYV
jgi:hypothetical protein